MIPTRLSCVLWVCSFASAFGCDPSSKKTAERASGASNGGLERAAPDAEALVAAAECEGAVAVGWCAASGWAGAGAGELRSGSTWLGVKATVRGARVDFSESAWALSVRGRGEGGVRVGMRELGELDERVRRGLAKQTLDVAKGVRGEVVMEKPEVAAALRAGAPTPLIPSRDGRGWRLDRAQLRSVGEGRWMSREAGLKGEVEWILWVDASLKRPDEVSPASVGVPLEKLEERYDCSGSPLGVKARACEVLERYAGAEGPLAEGEYAGWFVRPAGGETGSWSAKVEGGLASLSQGVLPATQRVRMSGARFEVTAVFEGREGEAVTVWARSEEGGGWAIARSKTSGAVWFGRLKPVAKQR